jgi:hypothetical protein
MSLINALTGDFNYGFKNSFLSYRPAFFPDVDLGRSAFAGRE